VKRENVIRLIAKVFAIASLVMAILSCPAQEAVLYWFTGANYDANPASNIVTDSVGHLFGTTAAGDRVSS
jgi:hypothetical protein